MTCAIVLMVSFQETADDHPHLDTVIDALGRVQNNGMYAVNLQLFGWKKLISVDRCALYI